jgi:hypothetical protein
LARLELRIGLNAWCDRVTSFRLSDSYHWTAPPTGMIHGPKTLELVITGAT